MVFEENIWGIRQRKYCSLKLTLINSRTGWVTHVAHTREVRYANRFRLVVGKHKKNPFGDPDLDRRIILNRLN